MDSTRNYLIGNLVQMKDIDTLKGVKNAEYLAHKHAMIIGSGYMLYFPCDGYVRGPYPESTFDFVGDTLSEFRR